MGIMSSSPVAADCGESNAPLLSPPGSPIVTAFWAPPRIQGWADSVRTSGSSTPHTTNASIAASNQIQEPADEENNSDEDGDNNDGSTSSTAYSEPSLCPCGLGFLSRVLIRRGAELLPIYVVLYKRHFVFHPSGTPPAAYAVLQPPENPGIPLFFMTSLTEAIEAFDGIISDYRDSDVIGTVTGEGIDRIFEVTEGAEKLEGFDGMWYRSYWMVKVEHVATYSVSGVGESRRVRVAG